MSDIVIIGAGPAGLTAAYDLVRRGLKPLVLEKRNKVGGLACTEEYQGFLFDMGGHRFFTKNSGIQQIWEEVMGRDFLSRPRLSRIYYKESFFDYPLKPVNALVGLGFIKGLSIMASYVRWRLFPYSDEETVEHWVTNRFG